MNIKSHISLVGSMAAACAVGLFTAGCANLRPGYQDPHYKVETVESLLTVKTVSTFSGKEGKLLNDELVKASDAAFVESGFKVADGNPDIKVTLSPSISVFDQAGEYYLMEGNADVSVVLPGNKNRQIAAKSFEAKGERKLGADKAERDVAGKISSQLKNWLKQDVTLEKTGVVAKTITVDCSDQKRNSDPEFVTQFISTAKSMDGVIDCALATQNLASRRMEFRVVYLNASFPNGFLNALIVKNPHLKLVWEK